MKKQSLAAAAAFALAASILAAGCGKKETASTETTAETSAVEESTEASTEETEESTQEETEESEAQEAAQYHMLQGTIVKMGAEGNVFTLQADDGNSYDIGLTDIRDVEVELAQDVHIAIAYIGEVLGGPEAAALEDVTLVVALPEQEEWTITTETGTTTANAMSTFSIKTEDGRELSFMKDNCPIEEGALAADSGDAVEVTYVASQGINFPIEIKAARAE